MVAACGCDLQVTRRLVRVGRRRASMSSVHVWFPAAAADPCLKVGLALRGGWLQRCQRLLRLQQGFSARQLHDPQQAPSGSCCCCPVPEVSRTCELCLAA